MTESNAGQRLSGWPVVVALLVWTAVAFAFLYFDPGYEPVLLNCMRLVGRTAACQAGQNTINDAWQWLHIWPLLIACASGYIAIVVIAVVGWHRRRTEQPDDRGMAGEETMRTQAEQITALRADQEFWRALAAEVGPSRYAEPGPMGDWSFADMAGHLAGWRERTINRILAVGRGEPEPAPPWLVEPDDEDEVHKVNEWIREKHADRSPAQLVAEYDTSYDRLIDALESLPAHLQRSVVPWADEPLVEVDFTGHLHDEHVAPLRAWLDGTSGSRPT